MAAYHVDEVRTRIAELERRLREIRDTEDTAAQRFSDRARREAILRWLLPQLMADEAGRVRAQFREVRNRAAAPE